MGKIFVAGNPLLKIDSLPIKLIPKLSKQIPQITFEEFDPTENFPQQKSIIILDTVIGLRKVQIIDNLNNFSLQKNFSLHDFDIGWNLALMQKAGLINKFKIIGVPPDLSEKEALTQVVRIIKANLL